MNELLICKSNGHWKKHEKERTYSDFIRKWFCVSHSMMWGLICVIDFRHTQEN